MILTVDEGFQRKLDDFNAAQGGGQKVAVVFDAKQKIWTVWVVPCGDTSHRDYDPVKLRSLLREFPDYSGRRGVKLFDWADEVKDPYSNEMVKVRRPLDDRLFKVLHMADTFKSRQHFEETFEQPEVKNELAVDKSVRDIAGAVREYWWNLDKVLVGAGSRGNWRWRNR